MKYLMDFSIPYLGLWSATCIVQFGIKRDSNAPIENHFKTYKHLLLNGKKHILAPRLIRLSQQYNDARLTERNCVLKTTRAQKKDKKKSKKEKEEHEEEEEEEEEKEIEVWVDKKCKTTKNNRYFTMPKYVDNVNYYDTDFDELLNVDVRNISPDGGNDYENHDRIIKRIFFSIGHKNILPAFRK